MARHREDITLNELESLFVNNEEIDRVGAYLNRFNPIRIMKMERMEIRHTAILAWLLDPQETHGFGDRFLKAFLAEALRGRSELGGSTALDISQSDLRDAEIRREWNNIDIFILSRRNQWAFVVENKFHSKQHEGQLSTYIKKARSIFATAGESLEVRGVFLTLLDEEPQDQTYAPLRYAAICEFLPRLIALEGQSIGQEVSIFLGHYLEVIKDAADMSEEKQTMEALARKLYRTHKKALDFVIEHGASSDFAIAVESLFGGGHELRDTIKVAEREYTYVGQNNSLFSFLPKKWDDAFGNGKRSWPGCEGYWAIEYPMICWFELVKSDDGIGGILRLFAEVGPISDHELRREIIDQISSIAEKKNLKQVRFQIGASEEGKRYSRFLKGNNIKIKDIQDSEELKNGMSDLLDRFQPCFEAIGAALPQFTDYDQKIRN